MADGGRLRLLLPVIADGLVVEPKAHQVAVLKTNIAAFAGVTHGDATDLGRLLANQVTGGLKLLQMRREVQSEYFRLLTKGQQDVIFLQLDKLLYVSCLGLASTDHFVFVNVKEVDFSSLRPNDKCIPLGLIAESCDVGCGTQFLDGDAAD